MAVIFCHMDMVPDTRNSTLPGPGLLPAAAFAFAAMV